MSPAARFASMIFGLENEAGMKPGDIMRQAGICRSTYYRFRNGEAKQPAYSTVNALAALYERRIGPLPSVTRR